MTIRLFVFIFIRGVLEPEPEDWICFSFIKGKIGVKDLYVSKNHYGTTHSS